jgi:hypothetical protein
METYRPNWLETHYPKSDFPWNFYFNGEAMPRWANCWNACDMCRLVSAEIDEWDIRITSQDLFILGCRIDLVGTTTSEDPLRFRVLALTLFKIMTTAETAIRESISKWSRDWNAKPDEVYQGIHEGLFKMIQLNARDGLAFWRSGYEADRVELLEAMSCAQLPREHPDYHEPGYLLRDRIDGQRIYERMRKELVHLIPTSHLQKNLRRQILQLPKCKGD